VSNIKSAEKRAKLSQQRNARNNAVKSSLKTAVKRFEKAISEKNMEQARQTIVLAIRLIDKAVTKGIVHKNTAARKKSRLQRKINQLAS
jgi:small subunit ribosomal protein S20